MSRFLKLSDFNTSLTVYLKNVPTLENFALILTFPFRVGTSFSRLFGCDERFTWLAVFDEKSSFRVTLVILQDPAETLVSLVSSLF